MQIFHATHEHEHLLFRKKGAIKDLLVKKKLDFKTQCDNE